MNLKFYTQPLPMLKVNSQFYLREQDIKDSEDFFQYYSDPKVGEHILAAKPKNVYEASQEIHYCRELFYQHKGIYWSLIDKTKNKMVGAIGIYINNIHQRGEICYDLAYEYWNRGLMTQALDAVVDFSFKTIGLTRLEATTLSENKGSNIILQKLGFKHEGTLKKYRYYKNNFYDVEMFALTTPAHSFDTNQKSNITQELT